MDYEIVLFFNQIGGSFLESALRLFNFFGTELFFILFIPFFFWCINKSIGKRLLILLLITYYLNLVLKGLIQRSRPFYSESGRKGGVENRLGDVGRYGLPSTYTMVVSTFWFYLSSLSSKISVKLISILIIIISGISRLVLGVNYLSDIVLAVLISLIVLLLFKIFEPGITDLCNQRYSVSQRIFLTIFSAITTIVIVQFLGLENIYESIAIIGVFLGSFLGIVLEKEYIGFKVDGALVTRLGRYFIGVVILSFTYFIFDEIYSFFELDNGLFIFIKYSVISFVATYPIPYIFVKMNLADNSSSDHL